MDPRSTDTLRSLKTSVDSNTSAECRCLCGSLVARIVAEGVELKCKRCKRVLIVAFEARSGGVRCRVAPRRRSPLRLPEG
jgi:hypothetical protein